MNSIMLTFDSARLIRFSLSAMALLLLALLLPRTSSAQVMAGTEYFRCLDQAVISMGECYLEADSYFEKVRCNIAQLADYAGCVSQYVVNVSGISTVLK